MRIYLNREEIKLLRMLVSVLKKDNNVHRPLINRLGKLLEKVNRNE